jgi:hypothetical protein
VQSQLKGVNKVIRILSEGEAIPARSEMVIEGKIQAKYISQVVMILASQADSVRHLQGLHAMTHILCQGLTIYNNNNNNNNNYDQRASTSERAGSILISDMGEKIVFNTFFRWNV